VMIAHDTDAALRAYEAQESNGAAANLMLQEFIPKSTPSIWMFNGYFDEGSDCLFGLSGFKVRQYPPATGQTSLGICAENQAVETLTTDLAKKTGYRGPIDIGFRYDKRDGQYKLLDVNTRIGATFRLFVAENGLDVARATYLDLTGQKPIKGDAIPGRKWIAENYDLLSCVSAPAASRPRVPEWVSSLRGIDEAAWFARDDPLPFAMLWWRFGIEGARSVLGRRFPKLSQGAG
jgi:D-aspartate ligase